MPNYRKLIRRLAQLCDSIPCSKRMLKYANIPSGDIPFSAASEDNWFEIVNKAEARGKLERLLQIMVDEYDDDTLLEYIREETMVVPLTDATKAYKEFSIDKKALKKLVAFNKLDNVLNNLDKIGENLSPDFQNTIILLMSRWNDLKNRIDAGTVSEERQTLQKNQIKAAINNQIDQINNEQQIQQIINGLVPPKPTGVNVPSKSEFEKTINTQSDIEPIEWLQEAIQKSKFVCKVDLPMGTGTGFLLPGNYLLTNHHVICKHFPQHLINCDLACKTSGSFNCLNNAKVIFGYQAKAENTVIYDLDPADTYIMSKDLDYALIKIKDKAENLLSQWGYATFDAINIPVRGEFVTIIQHPEGALKKIAMPDLILNTRKEDNHVFYKANTLTGSSGSPVFNQKWDVVALHHAGLDEEEGGMEVEEGKPKVPANRGILIGAILEDIKQKGIQL